MTSSQRSASASPPKSSRPSEPTWLTCSPELSFGFPGPVPTHLGSSGTPCAARKEINTPIDKIKNLELDAIATSLGNA